MNLAFCGSVSLAGTGKVELVTLERKSADPGLFIHIRELDKETFVYFTLVHDASWCTVNHLKKKKEKQPYKFKATGCRISEFCPF